MGTAGGGLKVDGDLLLFTTFERENLKEFEGICELLP